MSRTNAGSRGQFYEAEAEAKDQMFWSRGQLVLEDLTSLDTTTTTQATQHKCVTHKLHCRLVYYHSIQQAENSNNSI